MSVACDTRHAASLQGFSTKGLRGFWGSTPHAVSEGKDTGNDPNVDDIRALKVPNFRVTAGAIVPADVQHSLQMGR